MASRRPGKPKRPSQNKRHRKEPEPFAQALGTRVRTLRKAKKVRFDALVGVSELGRGYVNEVERGLAVPSVVTLCKLAKGLDVSAVDLLNGVCDDRPQRRELIHLTSTMSVAALTTLLRHAKKLAAEDEPDE